MTLKESEAALEEAQWSERPVRLQQRFLVLRKLGQGTYGKVQLALNKETNKEVAIKTIKKAKIESEEDMLRIRREIHIMASIRHPHIIHINEVFETRQKIVIVMQYASGGELYDYLGCHEKLPEEEARRIFRQIASAIYYCHKNRICHRDLKLENILLDEDGNAQIADFGLSNIFDERRWMSTFCGSALYASPEIVQGTPYKGPEVDCWSLGVLLYTLIYGTMPFDGRNFKELVSQITEGKFQEPAIKSKASGLIRSLLTPDISKRATISDVCKNSWVNFGLKESFIELVERMALENKLNGDNLNFSKLCLEKVIKNGFVKNSSSKTTILPERKNGKINLASILKNCSGSDTSNHTICDKPSLYEQILNYDIRFIINKLLTAVETSNITNEPQKNLPLIKEKALLKPWPRNGENSIVSKVDSAYVIPIFEVTSVVPKLSTKNSKFINTNNLKQHCEQKDIPTKSLSLESDSAVSKNEKKTYKVKVKKNGPSINKSLVAPKIEISTNFASSEKKSEQDSKLQTSNKSPVNDQKECETSQDLIKNSSIKIVNHSEKISTVENVIPSPVKSKKKEDNIFHLKGPFFRTKNHALKIARIFSMNFDQLNLSSLKAPERRHKKSPGKIVIPPTFDPAFLQNTICERKDILIFPTISVSENKEKIEKKIEKIKKAALNMNMIIRSNSINRLKIQKYLQTQAKKIQDLVSDENRSIKRGMEHIKRCETISAISEAYFGKCGSKFFSSFNGRHHSKKINFLSPDKNCLGDEDQFNTNILQGNNYSLMGAIKGNINNNFGFLNIHKSKSEELILSDVYSNYNLFNKEVGNFSLELNSGITFGTMQERNHSKDLSSIDNLEDFSPDSKQVISSNQSKQDDVAFQVFQNDTLTALHNKSSELHNCVEETCQITKKFNEIESNTISTSESEANNEITCLDTKTVFSSFPIKNCEGLTKKNSEKSTRLKRLSSEPCLENKANEDIPWSDKLLQYQNSSTDNLVQSSAIKSKDKKELKKKGGLSRRNTLGCITEFANNNINTSIKDENITAQREDFHDCLWMMYVNKKLFSSDSKTTPKYLSYPDMYNTFDKKRYLNDRDVNSKSVDEINMKLYEATLSNTPVYGLNEAKSAFLRKLLQNSDAIKSNYNASYLRTNRTKSVSEEILTFNENNDYLRKTQSERKLSMPQSIEHSEIKRTPFLSKFLNELEKQENLRGSNEKIYTRPTITRKPLNLNKKPKVENRNKSYLQLLSLKRIQEAEKELQRIEKSDSIESEDENSGSLLEALKAHGYKNVISQRFQNEENDEDLFTSRHPTNSLISRTMSNIPRKYFSNYDASLQNIISFQDYGENDNLNGFASPLPFHLETSFSSPRLSTQFVQNWLTTNLSERYLDSTKSERNISIIPEEQAQTLNAASKRFLWDKESSQSLEEDPSSSDSLDLSKEYYSNGISLNELSNENGLTNYSNTTRNVLLRNSSTSEDEREESVQDRIWRKSFYSRFNNSVLSRKDRSKLFDTDLLSDRSGFSNGYTSPLRSTSRERLNSFQWTATNKNLSPKRSSSVKQRTTRKDSFDSQNSEKVTASNSFKRSPSDNHFSTNTTNGHFQETQTTDESNFQ